MSKSGRPVHGFLDWLDDRTSYRALLHKALDEEVAGGARWAYVFGSGLLTVFLVQVVTGLILMATYTPSVTGAWSSVYYIQHKVVGGWFIRGLHHFGAQAMVVVLGMHLLQVVVYGAYRKPREITWWAGMGLLGLVQALALTGYLLPWDQKGYWATKVATNIAGTMPVVGAALQTLIVGGAEYGQSTITRFYALHVGVLPALLTLIVVAHVGLFRRNGATPPAGADLRVVDKFYPKQFAKDLVFSLLVLGVVALLTTAYHGAHLDAPADPTVAFPPRPEWYFLFLFQLLKYIPGSLELVGTVVLPGLAGAFLFALPFLDKAETNRVRDRMPWVGAVVLGLVAVGVLTGMSLSDDANDPDYQSSKAQANQRAERAIALATGGIPPGGPIEMLKNDPMTYGADLYQRHCMSCHVLAGAGEREAPDHTGFGSRAWLTGLLHDPNDDHYFGTTKLEDMESMVRALGDDNTKAVVEALFSFGHQKGDPPYDAELAKKGVALLEEHCMDCHTVGDDGAFIFEGPNLTGWGSLAYLKRQIRDPDDEAQYGELNEMPSFGDELTEHDIDMVAQYLRAQRFQKPDFPCPPAPPGEEKPSEKEQGDEAPDAPGDGAQ